MLTIYASNHNMVNYDESLDKIDLNVDLAKNIYLKILAEEEDMYSKFTMSKEFNQFNNSDIVQKFLTEKEQYHTECQKLINRHKQFLKESETLYLLQNNIDFQINQTSIEEKIEYPLIFCEDWKQIIFNFNNEYKKFYTIDKNFSISQKQYNNNFEKAYKNYKSIYSKFK